MEHIFVWYTIGIRPIQLTDDTYALYSRHCVCYEYRSFWYQKERYSPRI